MRKLLMALILALSFAIFTAPVVAQETSGDKPTAVAPAEAAPAEAPAEEAKPEEAKPEAPESKEEEKPAEEAGAGWIVSNFHIIVTGLLGILAALGLVTVGRKWIVDKVFRGKEKLFELVEESVVETYQAYVKKVRAAKAADGDGKLTKKEAAKARSIAVNKIKEKAKEHGLRIVSETILPVLIEKAINGIKKGK